MAGRRNGLVAISTVLQGLPSQYTQGPGALILAMVRATLLLTMESPGRFCRGQLAKGGRRQRGAGENPASPRLHGQAG